MKQEENLDQEEALKKKIERLNMTKGLWLIVTLYKESEDIWEEIKDDANKDDVIKDTKEYERCEIVEEFTGLKEEERLCLTLSLIAGYRPRQISEITGINQSTVRSYISRGKKKLRKGLSE